MGTMQRRHGDRSLRSGGKLPYRTSPTYDEDMIEDSQMTSDEDEREINVVDDDDLKKTNKLAQSSRIDPSTGGSPRQESCSAQVKNSGGVDQPVNNKWIMTFCYVVVVVVAVVSMALYFWLSSTEPKQSFEDVIVNFKPKLKEFDEKFPSQRQDSWRKIRTVVKATASINEPTYPGVISLLASSRAEAIANCLGNQLAASLKLAYNDSMYVNLNGKTFRSLDPDKAKRQIDDAIHNGLQNGGHVVLLEGLHYLPPKSGILFHGLCDNENAPFKQSIYIFTITTDKFANNEAEEEVTSFWKGKLTEEQRTSLETRIGNNIIFVNPEASLPEDCQ